MQYAINCLFRIAKQCAAAAYYSLYGHSIELSRMTRPSFRENLQLDPWNKVPFKLYAAPLGAQTHHPSLTPHMAHYISPQWAYSCRHWMACLTMQAFSNFEHSFALSAAEITSRFNWINSASQLCHVEFIASDAKWMAQSFQNQSDVKIKEAVLENSSKIIGQ